MTALSTCPKGPVYFDKQTWIQEESERGLLLLEGAEDSWQTAPIMVMDDIGILIHTHTYGLHP